NSNRKRRPRHSPIIPFCHCGVTSKKCRIGSWTQLFPHSPTFPVEAPSLCLLVIRWSSTSSSPTPLRGSRRCPLLHTSFDWVLAILNRLFPVPIENDYGSNVPVLIGLGTLALV